MHSQLGLEIYVSQKEIINILHHGFIHYSHFPTVQPFHINLIQLATVMHLLENLFHLKMCSYFNQKLRH